MPASRAAFTLLEICLTLCIGMILLMMAVPSVVGMLAEQRLHDSYERFEKLVRIARSRSLEEQKPYHLVWDKSGVLVEPVSREKGDKSPGERFPFAKEESLAMERVAALTKLPPAEWTFWPNGTCEPVIISYSGPAGRWRVSFDAMCTRGTFLQSDTL